MSKRSAYPLGVHSGRVSEKRVVVAVAGEKREGTIVEKAYTVKGGVPVVAVDLDHNPTGDQSPYILPLEEVDAA